MTARTDELTREVETSRSLLDATLSKLQDRLHPATFIDEMLGIGRRSGSDGGLYDLALDTVRRNPVPVLLVCAGLGVLVSRAKRGGLSATQDRTSVPARDDGPQLRRGHARLYTAPD